MTSTADFIAATTDTDLAAPPPGANPGAVTDAMLVEAVAALRPVA